MAEKRLPLPTYTDVTLYNIAGTRMLVIGPLSLNMPERSVQRHGAPVPVGGRAVDKLACVGQGSPC